MGRTIVAGAIGVVWAALTAPLWSEAPFSFDSAPGRLQKNVVPTDYTIDITPDVRR